MFNVVMFGYYAEILLPTYLLVLFLTYPLVLLLTYHEIFISFVELCICFVEEVVENVSLYCLNCC